MTGARKPTDAPPAGAEPAGVPEVHLDLPSRLEFLEIVDKVIDGVADQMRFDSDAQDAIAISVVEACTNAIQHGHGHDPERIVHVTFRMHDDRLEVLVRDEGQGFDVALVEDAGAPENLLKPRGRGIFIMRSVMDDVSFDATGPGTVCRLVKIRPPAEPEEEATPRGGLDDSV